MKTAAIFASAFLASTLAAQGDFSYSTTNRITGGAMASMPSASVPSTKSYYKGQKFRQDSGDIAKLVDCHAQTITTIDGREKTFSIMKFGDIPAVVKQTDLTTKIDVKETGQKKTVNGYNASELILTMDIGGSALEGVTLLFESDMWLSTEVPGASEVRRFYQRCPGFPWTALFQAGFSEMQRKIAEMGLTMLGVVKIKAQATSAAAKLTLRQAGLGDSDSMIEAVAESSDFSTAEIPDAVFAVPAGYRKVRPK